MITLHPFLSPPPPPPSPLVQVFTYQGTLQCFKFPFILLFTIGFIFIILLGLVLPSYLLYLVYRPQVSDTPFNASLTCELSEVYIMVTIAFPCIMISQLRYLYL